MILEAVFPTCAIFKQLDARVRNNATLLKQLASGEAYHEVQLGHLTAGSSTEGLAMEPGWGHPRADWDTMGLLGAQLAVSLPQSHVPRHELDNSCLEYAPEGCPSAYTMLRVTRPQALLTHLWTDAGCIEEADDHLWLHTANLNQLIQFRRNYVQTDPDLRTSGISGPAGQVRQMLQS